MHHASVSTVDSTQAIANIRTYFTFSTQTKTSSLRFGHKNKRLIQFIASLLQLATLFISVQKVKWRIHLLCVYIVVDLDSSSTCYFILIY